MSKKSKVCCGKNCTNNVSKYKYCTKCRNIKYEKAFVPRFKLDGDYLGVELMPVGHKHSQFFIVSMLDVDIVQNRIWWLNANDEIVCKDGKLVKLLARGFGVIKQIRAGFDYTRENFDLVIEVVHLGQDGVYRVPLGNEKFAKVDADIAQKLYQEKLSWHLTKDGYAKNSKVGSMHRYVAAQNFGDEAISNMFIDHVNGDRLDNRIENLRMATPKENAINRTNDPKFGKFLGVKVIGHGLYATVFKKVECYQSPDPVRCALCYDAVAQYCRGKFARVNDPEVYDFKAEPFPLKLFKLSEAVLTKLNEIKAKHSQYDGVHRTGNKWRATIKLDLGTFNSEEEAAAVYDKAVIAFKSDKPTNFPKPFYLNDELVEFKRRYFD